MAGACTFQEKDGAEEGENRAWARSKVVMVVSASLRERDG